MDWANATKSVQGLALSTFGSSYVYTHANASTETINAIFNSRYLSVDPTTGVAVSSDEPNLEVRLSDFALGIPVKGDSVMANSINYRILRMEKDGDGGATLFLQRTS